MLAKIKCSQCGAEITNLTISPGKWQKRILILLLLLLFPLMLFMVGILIYTTNRMRPKGDYRDDLAISLHEKRVADGKLQIVGSIENKGTTTWQNIQVEVEFFDADGVFIDEASSRLTSSMVAGQQELFKIEIDAAPERLKADDLELKLKVADAYSFNW